MAGTVDESRPHPWTLRFRDPVAEADYQRRAAVGVTQFRSGPLVAAALWVVGGTLTALLKPLAAGTILLVAAGMVAVNLATVALASRASTLPRQQLIGSVTNVLAGIAVLVLASVTDSFDLYAASSVMLIAVFAFLVLRLQLVFAAPITAIYVLSYAGFGLAVGAPGLPLNVFLVTAAVVAACAGSYALEAAHRREYLQRREIDALSARLDRLLHQYLSPDIARTLLEERGRAELGGELTEVTVLFADLQGFTPYSERSRPEDVVALLNAYFGVAVPAIFAEGGTVVQFVGDAVMAIFNAPLRQPDHALRAARAALRLQDAVATVADADPDADAQLPRFRVGLNSGEAIVGNIGSDEIRSFTAIGDTTNLAARLQAFAAPGQVVMGESTYELVRGWVDAAELGTPQLKGKSSPVRVFALRAIRDQAGDDRS